MATVFIDTSNVMMKDYLETLLCRKGFTPSFTLAPSPEIVLRDLHAHFAPYPPPPPYPTVAFVSGRDRDLVQLLRTGYKGYLRPGDKNVVRAVRAVLRGEVWGERRLIARAGERELVTCSPLLYEYISKSNNCGNPPQPSRPPALCCRSGTFERGAA